MKMFRLLLFIYLMSILTAVKSRNTSLELGKQLQDICYPVPSLFIGNRTRELECCETVLDDFYFGWTNQSVYLSSMLATLEAWNCPQFAEECTNRTFGFTPFTSLMYERFCNRSTLVDNCGTTVLEAQGFTVPAFFSSKSTNMSWFEIAGGLKSSNLNSAQLENPCIQVALFDSPSGGYGNYHETISYTVPFCPAAWCGYDVDSTNGNSISSWTCMPSRCRANIIILMTVSILLAVTITVANVTVIIVYGSSNKLLHSQTIFRFALGVADFIIGAVVFPSAAATLYLVFLTAYRFDPPYNVTGLARNLTETNTVTVQLIQTRIKAQNEDFSSHFVDIVGFFTTVSFTVSVYLLAVSGFDRFQALWRPLTYRQDSAKAYAYVACLLTWVLSILVSSLPFFTDGLNYAITGSMLVTMFGSYALILYACAFIFPLIFTWVVATGVYFVAKRNFKKRSNLSNDILQNRRQQRRLNRILSLIVTAFSLSVLPTLIVIAIVLLLPNTNPTAGFTYDHQASDLANSLELVASVILTCNSLWNCLIYSVRNKEFRKIAVEKYQKIFASLGILSLYRSIKKCKHKNKDLPESGLYADKAAYSMSSHGMVDSCRTLSTPPTSRVQRFDNTKFNGLPRANNDGDNSSNHS